MAGKEISKEKLFCNYYFISGNAEEAARKAGYSKKQQQTAFLLLQKESVKKTIKALKEEEERDDTLSKIKAGLLRLAFGSYNDCISLLLKSGELSEKTLREMDFFFVSEIKSSKTGGLEIKFYDRLKALSCLLELLKSESKDDAKCSDFYKAIEESAKKMSLEG